MIKVFLIVMACQAPDYTICHRMDVIERPDPVTCQMDRVPVSGWWRTNIQNQGYSNWSIFTRCELINTEKNGRRG